MKLAGWNPLRPRNAIGVALVLGILAGVWLGDLFKGFGLGPGDGTGRSSRNGGSESPGAGSSDRGLDEPEETETSLVSRPRSGDAIGPVHVLIDDRRYFIREDDKNREVDLAELVRLIERTRPNEDGLKAVVNRTASSRVTAENRLFTALEEAGVPKAAIYQPEQSVD